MDHGDLLDSCSRYDICNFLQTNSAVLQDISLSNLCDLDFDLSRSLKVKCDGVIGLSLYGFLLIYIRLSNHISISHRLALIVIQNAFSYTLSLGPNYEKSKCTKWSQTDLERYEAKGNLYMLNYDPQDPNFTLYYSMSALFPDNWGFWFLHRLQWWICYVRKKNVKNHKFKISKIPNVVLWRPLGRKFRKSWKLSGAICRRSNILKFSLP